MGERPELREIKAYVRPELLDSVIHALDGLGVCQMMIEEVRALASGVDTVAFRYSLQLGEKYSKLVKIELVCPEERSEKIVQAITDAAHLGQQGDGFIFVTRIVDMVDICTRMSLAALTGSTDPHCA